jgi:Spy/CpxP family protein refolding chaperone
MIFTARAAMLATALMFSTPLLATGLSNPTLEERQLLANVEEAQVKEGPEKRAFIEQHLALSSQDAQKFWPIYEQHQASLSELNRRRVENILIYARVWSAGSLDDQTANRLARELIAIEEDEVSLLKRSYVGVSKAVSPAQAARYVQIEARVRAMIRAQESVRVPLVK